MAFRKVESWVVTDRWVLAHFDDGHSGGTILLEYSLTDGVIQWRMVDFVQH